MAFISQLVWVTIKIGHYYFNFIGHFIIIIIPQSLNYFFRFRFHYNFLNYSIKQKRIVIRQFIRVFMSYVSFS
jgi:hypothetical protein